MYRGADSGAAADGLPGTRSQAAEAGEKIVILHTNDVHCALDDAIGYAGLAAMPGRWRSSTGRTG